MHQHHTIARLSRAALTVLLAGVAAPALTATSADTARNASSGGGDAASAGQAAPGPTNPNDDTIYVTAAPLFHDIRPERDLDQDAISSYGISTIDELVGEVQAELGDDEAPVIFVNGQRINDLSEIGALPVEALRRMQVLSRGFAVRAGGSTGQRVISLTLERKVRAATVTAAHKIATEGHWNADRGEAILTSVQGQTRANLALRVRNEDRLLESDRHIIEPTEALPFALTGNVVGFPDATGEIDPLLSALAGQTVTIAAIPQLANPTLADFAANANNPAVTDIGRFRSLRPNLDNYDLNGTFATRLTPWLTANATLELTRIINRYERGLPVATFLLSPANPASPFSRTVELAYFGHRPLAFRTRENSGDLNITLDADFGAWSANFNARHNDVRDSSVTERQTVFGVSPNDSLDPFATDVASLIAISTDLANSRTITNLAHVLATGPLFRLPAGDVQTSFEGGLAWNHFRSSSTFSTLDNANIRRDEQSIRGQVVIPLTSTTNHFMAAVGDISATAELARIHDSDVGSIHDHSLGITWDPRPILHVQGELRQTQLPPALSVLGQPAFIAPNVRVFDPLTSQTVDVTEAFGGDPNLRPETDKVRRVSAILRLVPRMNLRANAEYTDIDRRDFISPLPAASAAVMLAFPDRFVRNAQGVLTTIDLRPVNFQSNREKRLRWGLSMNAKLGGGPPPGTPGAPKGGPTTYLQLTADHSIVFSDRILIRPSLPPVDLLNGGAIGIGSGRVRHELDGTAALTSGGLGIRAGLAWRGRSSLFSRINGTVETLQFSPLLTFNLRAFADAGRVIPRAGWARGFRFAVEVVNATNSHQRVHDSFGNTPLQYQPAYRDPLGRTIEVELRKVF
jgi:iron complex outermembrane recepter protein